VKERLGQRESEVDSEKVGRYGRKEREREREREYRKDKGQRGREKE
jgi:hypothetical protein